MNKIARSSLQERLHKYAVQDEALKNILRDTKKRGKRTTRMYHETLTIKLSRNAVVPIRGKVNRLATDVNMTIIQKWARTVNLKINS